MREDDPFLGCGELGHRNLPVDRSLSSRTALARAERALSISRPPRYNSPPSGGPARRTRRGALSTIGRQRGRRAPPCRSPNGALASGEPVFNPIFAQGIAPLSAPPQLAAIPVFKPDLALGMGMSFS
jgi:hypothetical protein